ncbi:hypothetical protein H9K76_00120 [Diaphorobacter ruginosibacter]|uniref:Uncharacterized protein n=1 Tax=Diaphorobacter ruginosibacter TaxID=1715720 RepID=A0A7G9RKX4_9BURK|nr:hypothetical protein [Diaphorobacter ruginosibacter]QNN56249.1 hypothetical protein H9K76_17050 [Diaphorobacter ruginosibacter]QNN57353.1 hypothetical protein H9K76_00120 [Diaphorobacter ruginosibacter]
MVAALFVRADNHYAALGCDCYDIDRDALTWPGGVPGIFHPPCRAWGQLSHFAKPRDGERELALWSMAMVRRFGGVLEHPFSSKLWGVSGCGTFGVRDQHGGVLVPVMQSWFGHRAQKKTCLYIVGPVPAIEPGEVAATCTVERMGRAERERTPAAFAQWLVDLAHQCRPLELA